MPNWPSPVPVPPPVSLDLALACLWCRSGRRGQLLLVLVVVINQRAFNGAARAHNMIVYLNCAIN